MADPAAITAFLKKQLRQPEVAEVPAVEAAKWLDRAGLLADSLSRPGLPLRRLLRAGKVSCAVQRPPLPNGNWFVRQHDVAAASGAPLPQAAGASSQPKPVGRSTPDTPEPLRPARIPDSIKDNDPFKRQALLAREFRGFVRFKGVDLQAIPTGEGVYVVLRETDTQPRFLERNPAGRFKGKDPTVPVDELTHDWPTGSHCVYIGKASLGATGQRGLQQRIREFRQYGDGKAVGHSGGRRIWQLSDADDYVLAWLPTPSDDCGNVEAELLSDFKKRHGRLPIGNRNAGRSSL
jgi:hypothetical protein